MERWLYQECYGLEPGLAMGLDEAALECKFAAPLLRCYTWQPSALSLGYFQRRSEVPALACAQAVVRRSTGGGAIHHASELTFSIAVERKHPLYAGPVAASYRRIHGILTQCFARLGIRAELCGERSLASDQPGTGMCFHASTPLDLVWNGRKGVGSAQRRTRERILHHGSIKLAPDPLEAGVATLQECGRDVAPAELAALLRQQFAQCIDIEWVEVRPEGDELKRAEYHAPRFHAAALLDHR